MITFQALPAEELLPVPKPPSQPTTLSLKKRDIVTRTVQTVSRHMSVKKGWRFNIKGRGANLSFQSPKNWHFRFHTPLRVRDGTADFFLWSKGTWRLQVRTPIHSIQGNMNILVEPKKTWLEVKVPLHVLRESIISL
ncbi:MAG: hypothetical protein OYG31_00995 [Candidatus Kaiserbacteria bacterium]|nr:hypothetical protein [Candidatus Kaiserbacteria bacterium]